MQADKLPQASGTQDTNSCNLLISVLMCNVIFISAAGKGFRANILGIYWFSDHVVLFCFFLNHILHKISAGGWAKDLLPQEKTAVKDLPPAQFLKLLFNSQKA